MLKATVVIHVQMGENDPLHIARPDSQHAQLRTDFFFAVNSKRDFPSDIGMKRLPGFEQMHSLASVDHDDTFLMVNDPRVCW